MRARVIASASTQATGAPVAGSSSTTTALCVGKPRAALSGIATTSFAPSAQRVQAGIAANHAPASVVRAARVGPPPTPFAAAHSVSRISAIKSSAAAAPRLRLRRAGSPGATSGALRRRMRRRADRATSRRLLVPLRRAGILHATNPGRDSAAPRHARSRASRPSWKLLRITLQCIDKCAKVGRNAGFASPNLARLASTSGWNLTCHAPSSPGGGGSVAGGFAEGGEEVVRFDVVGRGRAGAALQLVVGGVVGIGDRCEQFVDRNAEREGNPAEHVEPGIRIVA